MGPSKVSIRQKCGLDCVDMQDQIQAIVTVLSLINPAVCAAIFTSAERGRQNKEKRIDATKAAVTVLIILVLAALGGTRLLHIFGLSLLSLIHI